MADEYTPLASLEYPIVGAALFDAVSSYVEQEHLDIVTDYQAVNGPGHIGVITASGGRYLNQDVTGGYEAQLPFQILYETAGTNNAQNMAAEELLENLAARLERKPLPELPGNRTCRRIIMDSITYKSKAGDDGGEVFVRSGTMQYDG